MTDAVIAAAVAGVAAGVPAVAVIVAGRRKASADAGRTVGGIYADLLGELRSEMLRRDTECERRVAEVRSDLGDDIAHLKRDVELLTAMVVDLGGSPPG